MKTKKTVAPRDRRPAIEQLARVATLKANKGKCGPIFGEVTLETGTEIVRHFLGGLVDRVLKKGERVRLAGFGTFYVASLKATTKRAEVTHRLAFSAAGEHRGLPKKGATP